MRMGLYQTLTDYLKATKKPGSLLSFPEKCLISVTAGGVASIFGNPFDLALIRMQADGMLKPEERRNYNHVFNAIGRIVKEEGLFALWRGCTPTVIRAMVINFGMLGPYDECKERLRKYLGDTKQNALASSAIAGFLAAFFCLPFDNVKTKVQKMKKGPDGKFPYSGLLDCFIKSIRREGFTKLWTSFPTFYVRIAPHAMITLLMTDYLKNYI